MKQGSISPVRLPFTGTTSYLEQQNQPTQNKGTTQKNPPRESCKKASNFQLCPETQVKTCHCPGSKFVILPSNPNNPLCPKKLSKQFAHWNVKIKHK